MADVLRIATINAAKLMKRDKDLGAIAAGKMADIIIVDGNPRERMSDIRRVTLVMKDGRIHDPRALSRDGSTIPRLSSPLPTLALRDPGTVLL